VALLPVGFTSCYWEALAMKRDKRLKPLELRLLHFEDLSVGMTETLTKTVSSNDVVGFAELTGDRNTIHSSEHFAAKSDVRLLTGAKRTPYAQSQLFYFFNLEARIRAAISCAASIRSLAARSHPRRADHGRFPDSPLPTWYCSPTSPNFVHITVAC
jgi:hypothetical protein